MSIKPQFAVACENKQLTFGEGFGVRCTTLFFKHLKFNIQIKNYNELNFRIFPKAHKKI